MISRGALPWGSGDGSGPSYGSGSGYGCDYDYGYGCDYGYGFGFDYGLGCGFGLWDCEKIAEDLGSGTER